MNGRPTVDSKVPRAKAFSHAALGAIAFLAGPSIGAYVLAFTGLVMAASVLGGPRFSLLGRLFTSVIRPAWHIKPGQPEDPRPHRFSEGLGAVFLLAAAVLYVTGEVGVGQILALAVVTLALLNAVSGFCVGCQMYLLVKRLSPSRTTEPGNLA